MNGRLPDGGPRYVETPPDPAAPGAPIPAEPWNTATAALFIVIAAAWLWKLRGRYRDYPFVASCMLILLAGGVGGTLFHGTRVPVHVGGWSLPVFFLLDVIPIQLLGLAGAVYMAFRYLGRNRLWLLFPIIAFYAALNGLFFQALGPMNKQLSINLSYASIAVIVLAPITLVLIRTRFRHGGWVAVGLLSFGIAWCFRLIDQYSAEHLTMGTHWLWHTFGALSTAAVVYYFFKIEGDPRAVERPGPELPQA
jgi:hypothetical protein